MNLVRCDVREGLRKTEVVAAVTDARGRKHEIRVEGDFLIQKDSDSYLPVGLIQFAAKEHQVLIEFPHEPDSGINRIWVSDKQLHHSLSEAFA